MAKELKDTVEETVDKVKKTVDSTVNQVAKQSRKGLKKLDSLSNDAAQKAQSYKNKTVKTVETYTQNPVPTETVSKIGFWSGLGSLVFGFPANVVGIVSGHIIEDRRKASKVAGKKLADLAPTPEAVTRSRIGAAAGYVSLIAGIVAVTVYAVKRNNR